MYKPKSEVEVILSGNYYGWTLDKQVAAWHKPDFSLGIDSRFKVFDDLFLRVGMSYLGQRKVLDYSFDDTIKTLEGVFDFNLGADYYRITSYNVCYTKLLRLARCSLARILLTCVRTVPTPITKLSAISWFVNP